MIMRLSLIVPVLNEAEGITATLSRLQPLRDRGHEVIVVDGGSTDTTAERARRLADQVLVARKGRARQMNAGAAVASGDVLLFLHADTRLPGRARYAIEAALTHSSRVWGRFDVRIEGSPRMLKIVALMMNLRSRLSGIATGDQAIFVRREAFVAVGGYPDQPLMEDVELSKRLKRLAPPVCLAGPAVTSGRRWEIQGVWRTIFLMWQLRFAYWCGVSATRLAQRYHAPTSINNKEAVK
jgi:rSAM/selenodomain-associated transferase 2